MKTYTVKQLIQELKKYEKIDPDMPVYLSRDEEGNGFGTIWRTPGAYSSIELTGDTAVGKSPRELENKMLIIYPFEENMDFSELEGHTNGK